MLTGYFMLYKSNPLREYRNVQLQSEILKNIYIRIYDDLSFLQLFFNAKN